jgi:DNA-binding IclR family transcriptional regulator
MSTVQRAVTVLNALAASERPCRFAELSRKTQLPAATLRRLLVELMRAGLVEQEPHTCLYRLGVRLAELSHCAFKTLSLGEVALPIMRRLVSRTGESCYLARLASDPTMVTYVEAVYSEQLLAVTSYAGRSSPAHCTATGKVLLAYAPESVRRRVLETPLERRTTATITDPQALAAELTRVAARGYAVTQQEFSEDISAVAAPIRNHLGQIDTAIAICGPASRLRDARLVDAIDAVVASAAEISEQIALRTRAVPETAGVPA